MDMNWCSREVPGRLPRCGCLAYLLAIATAHVLAAAATAVQADVAQETLDSMLAREEAQVSGSARLKVTVACDIESAVGDLWRHSDFSFLTGRMSAEVGEGVLLDYAWSGTERWRIEVRSLQEQAIRTLVWNGSSIDTGDNRVWDNRFHTTYGRTQLSYEFAGLLWPYYVAAYHHVFPMTFGKRANFRLGYSFFQCTLETRMASGEDQGDPRLIGFRTRHDLAGLVPAGKLAGLLTIDVANGYALLRKAHPLVGMVVTYDDHELVSANVRMPRLCRYAIRADDSEQMLLWTSELVSDRTRVGDTPSDTAFQIVANTAMQQVCWPKKQRRAYSDRTWLQRYTRFVRRVSPRQMADQYFDWVDEAGLPSVLALAGLLSAVVVVGGAAGLRAVAKRRSHKGVEGRSKAQGQK